MDRPIIFVARSVGGIVLKYVCDYCPFNLNPSNGLKQALIQASLASEIHLPDYKAIELSTYGLMFLGTPHQGAKGVDLATLLLQIHSVYSRANTTVVQHLPRNSEFLQLQLSLYASISAKFDTKFLFEAYPTQIFGGQTVTVSYEFLQKHSLDVVELACPEVLRSGTGDGQRRGDCNQQRPCQHGQI